VARGAAPGRGGGGGSGSRDNTTFRSLERLSISTGRRK
jgi:casein kinase 1 epsilon